MIGLLFVSFALGHGGEDHSAPAAPTVTVDATSARITASSAQFDSVLRVQRGEPGTPVLATLMLADFATGAPVSDAAVSVALQGPAPVEISLAAVSPGTYKGTATFPAEGDYSGALVVTTADAADILALTGLQVGPLPTAESGSNVTKVLGVLGGMAVLGVGSLVTLGIGFALGRRRAVVPAALLAAAAVATPSMSAHGSPDHESAPEATPADTSGSLYLPMERQFLVGMRTARLAEAAFVERVPALGRFVARAGGSATLRAPTSGELLPPQGGFPAPGSVVRAGQVLGTIRVAIGSADRAALAEARQSAATAVAEAKKGLVLAERDVAGVTGLVGTISARESVERQQSLRVAQTALAEAERTLSAVGDGGTVPVRAPVEGRLGSALVRPGDQVEAGDELFRVVDAAGLWMEARIPERLAAGINVGDTARVIATAFPDQGLDATVLDAGQEAATATGTFTLTLAVDTAGIDLHPGMSATAWVGREPPRDALVVPDTATVDSAGLALSFVKVGPERFELRELSLGGQSGEIWEVRSGLEPGERVVTDATYTLRSIAGR